MFSDDLTSEMRAIFPGDPNDHHITPKAGTARQLDGAPADLLNPLHYPVLAVCAECGRAVRCERYFYAEWEHLPDVQAAIVIPFPAEIGHACAQFGLPVPDWGAVDAALADLGLLPPPVLQVVRP